MQEEIRSLVVKPILLLSVMVLIGGFQAIASDAVVTFNEINYHTHEGGSSEWIELHNQMSIRVDLSGWRVGGGVDYEIPEGTVIEPGGFLLITGAGSTFPNSAGPFEGRLNNGGDRLTLRDRNRRVMDQLEYDDALPWPVGAAGSEFTLSKKRPSTNSADPDAWSASADRGGTPGAVNTVAHPLGDLVISEIGSGWVELHNRGGVSIALTGTILTTPTDGITEFVFASIAPNAYLVHEDDAILAGEPVFLLGPDARLIDAVNVRERVQGRLPTGEDWYFVEHETPGLPNEIHVREEIVINEIMYHFPPVYDQPGTLENEYAEQSEEWLELYNRGDESVDLSGWHLADGIRFTIPDGTVLLPNSYLVVARDADSLREKYPEITILGDFDGKLGNSSDLVTLRDAADNPVDCVHYYDSGRWPRYADGGGSSLELRDPWADNGVPEAWFASDESAKSTWVDIAYEGRATSPPRSNNPSNFHEFLMGLLGAGEALIDDVSVVESPGGGAVEVLPNGGFERTNFFTQSLLDWRLLGTHAASHVIDDSNGDGRVLHLIADGAIEHTYNNASITFDDGKRISSTETYAISLRAKWLRGSPQLNTRLYLNRLARTHLLPIPDQLGTPGRENSRFTENLGPTFENWRISPLDPGTNEPIAFEVEAFDPHGIGEIRLWYQREATGWQVAPMMEMGGVYQGEIPGQSNRSLIQFYLEAIDNQGAGATFPAAGRDSRALLRVGEPRTGESGINHVRLLMLPDEHTHMRRAEHAVSNGRIGGTLIANNEDYHFDVGVRLRSSPFGRRSNRTGYNVVFGKERPYRGVHDSIAIDRGDVMPNGNSNGFFAVKAGAGVNELVVNQLAQRARGIPTTYEDVIFIETPTIGESSLAQVRMARYGNLYLDSQFEDGAQGATHKFELIYHPVATIDGERDGLKGPYTTVLGVDIQDMRDDKEAYRYNFIPTNNRDRDDFTGIIRLGDAFSSRTDTLRRERIPQAIDVDQWMRVFAFQSLIGVADTYNMGLSHNLVLYTRPSDGRVLAFPWDLDHAFFYSTSSGLLGRGNTNLARFIDLPENKRLFYGHLSDIIDQSFNLERMQPWIDHLNEVTGNNYEERFTSYITRRGNFVKAEIKREVSERFQIITNRGNAFETDASSTIIEGNGGVNVRAIRNNRTGDFLDVRWIDLETWQAEIPLVPGQNQLELQAIGFQGEELGTFFLPGSDAITITHTGTVAAATPGSLVIREIHYHPSDDEGDVEFIELQNVSGHTIDLAGLCFTRGIEWKAGDEAILLAPGALALVVRNRVAIEEAYGPDLLIIGEFDESRLNNDGERMRFENRFGQLLQDFRYDDNKAWSQNADGVGRSLVYRSGDPDNAASWRASLASGGSPGAVEGDRYDGLTDIEFYAFGGNAPIEIAIDRTVTFRYRHAADDLGWEMEGSKNMETWEPVESLLEFVSRELDQDTGDEVWRWQATSPQTMYLRARLSGAP